MRYRPFLPRFRSRFALGLQWVALVGFLSQPLFLNSSWSDADNDQVNDLWNGGLGTFTITALNAQDADIDGDNATNEEEAAYNSDPFAFDTDGDGLGDGDEIHLAIQQEGKSYSLTSWDSNNDEVSDYDDFHSFAGVTYPGGQLPSFPNASYSDYDGDGQKNPVDSHPTDPSNGDFDGDGIDEAVDPVPGNAANPSSYNNMDWHSDALGDVDGDGTLNFWDFYPEDPSNGSTNDQDSDGMNDSLDPAPTDPTNYSETNGITWHGDAVGDADEDSVINFNDSTPYPNSDGDCYPDHLDPAPEDSTNLSSVNSIAWGDNALGDDDNDQVLNFDDPAPYPPPSDDDMDGYIDSEDPVPDDADNPSPYNGMNWHNDVFGDSDADTILNFRDPLPYDPVNISPANGLEWSNDLWDDADSDGVMNFNDPAPGDVTNYSATNDFAWGTQLFEDHDADQTLNFYDPTPFPDTDGDGYVDPVDPNASDPANYSAYNNTEWHGNALADSDSDTILNFYDPLPSDPSNPSPVNGLNWPDNVWGNDDVDNYANFYDPVPNDSANHSDINNTDWYSDALGDSDYDGLLNFFDPEPWTPPPPADNDQDGLNVDEETTLGTSDDDVDSDDDGLTDFEEVSIYSTVPTNKFYLSEQLGWGSLYPDYVLVDSTDTDGDTIPDRVELHYSQYGMQPSDPADGLRDIDHNGLSNKAQYALGMALDAEMSGYDADQDGMTDVFENYYQLNSQNFYDAVEDPDGDGVTNFEEMMFVLNPQDSNTYDTGNPLGDLYEVILMMLHYGYPPSTDDVDINNIPDWADTILAEAPMPGYPHFAGVLGDLDGDGISDWFEHKYGRWKFTNGLQLRVVDSQDDNDADGLINWEEFNFGTSPIAGDSDGDGIPDPYEFDDGDGISSEDETRLGTRPWDSDSDDDGVSDGEERMAGTDPLNAASNPRINLIITSPTR